MIYRITIVTIIAFWALMVGLLVRNEVFPEKADGWLAVPPKHVVGLLFTHEEDSELAIFDGDLQLGTLYIRPRIRESGDKEIVIRGDFLLRIPTRDSQRVYIESLATMGEDYTAKTVEFDLKLKNPTVVLSVNTSTVDNQYSYKVSQGESVLVEKSGTLGSILNEDQLQLTGIDTSSLMDNFSLGDAVKAKRSSVKVKGDKIDVFQLQIAHTEDLFTNIYVNQIGKIVKVDTFFGYSLVSDGVDL